MSKPPFLAYTVREYKVGRDTKSSWCRIGAAWPTKSGEGFNITLDALPIDGRITLMPPKPEDKAAAESMAQPEQSEHPM